MSCCLDDAMLCILARIKCVKMLPIPSLGVNGTDIRKIESALLIMLIAFRITFEMKAGSLSFFGAAFVP